MREAVSHLAPNESSERHHPGPLGLAPAGCCVVGSRATVEACEVVAEEFGGRKAGRTRAGVAGPTSRERPSVGPARVGRRRRIAVALGARAGGAALTLVASAPLLAVGTAPTLGIRANDARLKAFVNARIVVSPAETIERGVLVVEEGRVVAVGEAPTIPPGAFRIDLNGKTVYPGFIDPYTEYGLEKVGALYPEKKGRAPKYEGSRAGAGAWNDAVHAEREWVASFEPNPEAAGKLLERGVTAVHSAKLDGVFRGRGFVASLGEGLPNDLVLRPQALHVASFDKGSSQQAYPSSLMGSIALVRQALLDAAWYGQAHGAWERNPAQERPEIDRAIGALAANREPIVFETEDELSLLRAGRISRELAVPFIHVGSNREYRRLDEIATLGQPVVLPLSFPKKPDVDTYEDELDVTLSELRHWERAPGNAAALAARGVTFAFTGHGLREGEDFWKNLRGAVRRGLAPAEALAALTAVPARLLGLEARIGTLEPGRLANFVVAEGDLFAEGGEILAVWVAGEKVKEIRPPDAADFRGRYELALAGEAYELTLTGEATSPKGSLARGEGKAKLEGVEVAAHRLTFRVALDPFGGVGSARLTLIERAGEISGRAAMPDGRLFPVVLSRLGDAPPEERAEEQDRREGADDGATETEPEAAGVEVPPGAGDEEKKEKAEATPAKIVSRQTLPNTAFGFEAPPAREDVLVRDATLWTLEGEGVIEEGDLLVVGGRIAAVGSDLAAPPGVRVIDARGKHLTPGIIDEHSHLAISAGVNEGSHAVTSEVRIGDVVDPADVGIYRALAGGVTAAQLLHGSANPIGGQAQVIKLRWGASAEGLKFAAAPPTIKFALGENVKQSNWGEEFTSRYPQTRMGVEALIRDRFVAAREYGDAWARYRALAARERERAVPPRRDLQLEALLEILGGERFIHCHSYVQSEILALMRLAEELGFRVQTFTHILEGYKVAPEMAAHGAGASSFSDWWAYKFEVYDAIPYNPCLLHKHGVITSVNSDSEEMIRRLNQEAGKSVLYCGMEEVEALKLVTFNPALQLRIADRVGSLAPGKDADFVIWSGHPLSMYARAEETWIEGTPYFTQERDAALREADRAERQALIQKVLAAPDEKEGAKAEKKAARDAAGGSAPGETEAEAGERERRRARRVWQCDHVEDYWHVRR